VLTILYLPMGLMGLPARLRQPRVLPDTNDETPAPEQLAA
jgi:hypothetical protein